MAVGDGYGTGTGYGYGYGTGYGYGFGYGDGTGYGYGFGYGDGDGYGYGFGTGYGYGSGDGSGYGFGTGYGYGDGYGDGTGFGTGGELAQYMGLVEFPAVLALTLPNAELRRAAIERIGPDRLFAELRPTVVHEDTDGVGNPRRLLRIPMDDAAAGYLQAVEVTCPTTGRVYHLGVQPDVVTCQEAVAATFGLSASEYQPMRET